MGHTRATIAGIGSTGSLVAAALSVFSLASALVAFDGWPGLAAPGPVDALVVSETTAPPLEASGPARAAAEATSSAAAVVSATPARVVSGVGDSAGDIGLAVDRVLVAERSPRDGTGDSTRPGGGTDDTGDPERGLFDLPPVPVPEPVPSVTNTTADATTAATASLGGAVATTTGVLAGGVMPLSPELGQTLAGAGGLLAGAVAATGDLVAELLRGDRAGAGR